MIKKNEIQRKLKFQVSCGGGDGAYLCVKEISDEIHKYFKKRGLSLKDYAFDSDYADIKKIPEKMRPFEPGLRAEFGHYECGMTIGNNLDLTVETDDFNEIYSGKIPKSNIKKNIKAFDLIENYDKGIYLVGYEGLEDCYITGEFELNTEFDIKKFNIQYSLIDYAVSSRKFISSITYNKKEIDWWLGEYEGTGDYAFDFVIIE